MKKMISMNYGNSTSSWKPWRCVRLDLVFSMGDIYISFNLKPLTKFTSSSRRAKLKDFLPWNISQMITRTIPISTSIVISSAMKQSILLWIWWMGSQWKLIQQHGQNFPTEEKPKFKQKTPKFYVRILHDKVIV